jgi:hypothetical protein
MAGAVVILMYAHRSQKARAANQSQILQDGEPIPPFKKVVCGKSGSDPEGMQLNKQMEQWQKTYHLIRESADEQQYPSLLSTRCYKAKVEHFTQGFARNDRPLNYQEFQKRRRSIEQTLSPDH